MHIRYVYTNEHGREVTRPALPTTKVCPPINATVAEYPINPVGRYADTPPEWKLRVVGAPEIQYVGGNETWLVPCEVVGE